MNYQIIGKSISQPDTRVFLQELIPHLAGLRFNLDDENSDVSVSFGNYDLQQQSGPVILRWDSTCNIELLNHAAAVIFSTSSQQQQFSHPFSFVIHEAIDTNKRSEKLQTGFQSIRQDFDTIFVSASPVWCEADNPRAVIKTYDAMKRIINKKCCLILMGDGKFNYFGRNDIFITPWLSKDERLSLFSMSNWNICHSTRAACPVDVLESLSQGTPIIHGNQQDILEIVKNYGTDKSDMSWIQPKYPWDLRHINITNTALEYFNVMTSIKK